VMRMEGETDSGTVPPTPCKLDDEMRETIDALMFSRVCRASVGGLTVLRRKAEGQTVLET